MQQSLSAGKVLQPALRLLRHRRAAGQVPLGNRIEQLIRPPQEGAALIDRFAPHARRLGSHERPLAMLACNPLA